MVRMTNAAAKTEPKKPRAKGSGQPNVVIEFVCQSCGCTHRTLTNKAAATRIKYCSTACGNEARRLAKNERLYDRAPLCKWQPTGAEHYRYTREGL